MTFIIPSEDSDFRNSTMLKGFIISFLMCLSAVSSLAQENLISNGDFEYYTECPTYQNLSDELNKATPWYNPTANTPDYYNICDSLIDPTVGQGVPYNWQGFQFAHSGFAYAGFTAHSGSVNGRDYLSCPLRHTLDSNRKYILTFYLNLSNYSQAGIGCIGAYFSADSIKGDTTAKVLNVIPQIQYSPNAFLIDTMNWMKMIDTFIAYGNEKFITLGNFNDDAHTPIDTFCFVPYDWYSVYYYIDDVSLYEVDTSQTDTTQTPPFDNLIIPNLLSGSVNPYWHLINLQPGTRVTLYNILGQLLYQSLDYKNDMSVNQLAAGIYLYVTTPSNGKVQKGKLVIGR